MFNKTLNSKGLPIYHIKNVGIMYPNFSGKRDMFGNTGCKFNIVFNDIELGEEMIGMGYNIKVNEAPDGSPLYSITVRFNWVYPPQIKLIMPDGTSQMLDEETVGVIDNSIIDRAEIEVSTTMAKQNPHPVLYLRRIKVYVANDWFSMEGDEGAQMELFDLDEGEDIPF